MNTYSLSARQIKAFDEIGVDKISVNKTLDIALTFHSNRINELTKLERELWKEITESHGLDATKQWKTEIYGEFDRTEQGMTLRDYFAAKCTGVIEPPVNYVGKKETEESYRRWAERVYRMADAMLKARE